MLGYFPTPYPDELFYSTVSRYCQKLSPLNPRKLMKDLFQSKIVILSYDFPQNLRYFCEQLSVHTLITPNRLINEHTLFPFYRPFLPQKRCKIIETSMQCNENRKILNTLTGAGPSGIQRLEYLKYCPACVNDDREHFREAYWHRSHQLVGIRICHKHLVPLEDSQVQVVSRSPCDPYVPLEKALFNRNQMANKRNMTQFDSFLATSAYWLLNNTPPVLGLEELQKRYKSLLFEKNLTSPSGTVRQKKLYQSITDFFGDNFPDETGCNFRKNVWLKNLICLPSHAFHPLWHLLLMEFLGVSPAEFFSEDFSSKKPFGDPPYPCLNAAAVHFRKPMIEKVKYNIHQKSRKPVGKFVCACGFAYSRIGFDESEEDRFKKSRIISFGPIWESKLLELAKDRDLGISKIAKLLGVSCPTVKRYLKIISEKGRGEKLHPQKSVKQAFRTKYRQVILETVKYAKTRTEITRIAVKEYDWLRNNDRDWLYENLPLPVIDKNTRPSRRLVDWDKRDDETYAKAKEAVASLMKDSAKPTKITATSIGRKILISHLCDSHYINRLPKTKKLLEDSIESVEDFQIRRIRWVSKQLRENGDNLLWSKIIVKASINGGISEKVAEEIKKQVESI